MEERLVSFETAKLAKEKGFNWKTHTIWIFDNERFPEEEIWHHRNITYSISNILSDEPWYYSPTQSHLAKWLREIHGIQVYAYSSTKNGKDEYRDYVVYINGRALNDARDEEYQIYEDAMEFGLKIALKMVLI